MLYEMILGERFKLLNPEIQKRYQETTEGTLQFKGIMALIEIHPLLIPLASQFRSKAFLLNKSGTNIPFEITFETVKISEHIYDVLWKRTFYFTEGAKRFDSTMRFDLQNLNVTDTLGNPGVIEAPLQLDVSNGGSLIMRSHSGQRLKLLNQKITIPSFLSAKAYVEEGYDESRKQHSIHLSTYNDLIGNLMKYVGYFSIETTKNANV